MSEDLYNVEFKYETNEIPFQCNPNQKMEEIIENFIKRVGIKNKNL